jgi:hypothetical protein
MTILDNLLPPGPREYLHIDNRRIDSYFEQISDPIKYDKVPVWKIGMKLTGPSAEGSQIRPGRSYTIHEKIDAIVEHLYKKHLIDEKSMSVFNLEKRTATQVLIPVKKEKFGRSSLIHVWISLGEKLSQVESAKGSVNNLILLEDHPVSDDSQWFRTASVYTTLLLLGDEIQAAGYSELAAALQHQRSSFDAEEKFADDPIGFLEQLGGHVGAKRHVVTLYRMRTSLKQALLPNLLFGSYPDCPESNNSADWIVGYSIFIAAA